jgi:hypothetical protein
MQFENASAVEQIVWQLRLADYPRAQNRALINSLFNGVPPFTEEEQEVNNQSTNYNDLSATKIDHDARSQFDNAFLAPNPLFTVNLDYGPAYKRQEWSGRITKEINKRILNSEEYLDLRQGVFASVVLHGIGPAMWEDRYSWCPVELGVEDVLIPSNTLRSLRNLPMYAVYREYTAEELYRRTHGPKRDTAWNMPLVNKLLKWLYDSSSKLLAQNWPAVWSPEKMHERFKQDSGYYASDAVPTVNCFDFYFWNDNGEECGWNRRIVLDAWGDPGIGGIASADFNSRKNDDIGKGEFLYNPGDRIYSSKRSELIHFQFGDASAVAPFRYHSVRSLGFLLYSVCELQNRLKCRFTDAVFEHLLQYFRVGNPADMDRLSKIDLVDKGILPEGLQFVKPEERWRIDEGLILNAMQLGRQSMSDVSSAFTQDLDFNSERDSNETATRTMAKVNSSAALVGSILNRAYAREKFRYIEICRRFCLKDSKDNDVRDARVCLLSHGVPEEALNVDAWEVTPNRVIGQGNKLLQVAIADKLMAIRPQLDPDAQNEVDRIYIAANSNDWDLANRLKPEVKKISNSVMLASAAIGPLMAGVPVPLQEGINHTEYIEKLLTDMALIVKRIESAGGMATPQELMGLQTMGQHIGEHIKILAQDKNMKPRVKQYGDMLKNLSNAVKAYAQRLQEQAQGQNGADGPVEEAAAKAQADALLTQAKIERESKSHAQRTAQRQIQFEQKTEQDRIKADLELKKATAQAAIDIGKESTKAQMQAKRAKKPPETEA